jgi:hypothetical protein
MKTLILYTYCEIQIGPLSNKQSSINLKYFLNNALINNNNYSFFININGSYKFDFSLYLTKFPNLNIIQSNGTSALHGYTNILSQIDYNIYDNFFFITDKVSGPHNLNGIKDWINYYSQFIDDNNVIISAYGTSPMGKLYKFPYIAMKFMCINKKNLKLILNNNFFTKNLYDTKKIENHNNPDNIFEIKLSIFFLENNVNYIAVDNRGINNLNILYHYRKKNWLELREIIKKTHAISDCNTIYRLFWTGNFMNKLHNDKKFYNKIIIQRDTSKLEHWI